MASPAPVGPSEGLLARSGARGQSPPAEPDAVAAPLADLPDHRETSDADLLSCLREGDALAFVEVYQRTSPAAHAVARRLLTDTGQVEGALRVVYRDLWLSPPQGGSLTRWVRARCFAVATADLDRRGAAPAAASLAALLDLPAPDIQYLMGVEQALLGLPERQRQAVVLAHDVGVPAADQPEPDAADLLEVGLLGLSDLGSSGHPITPSGVAGLADWALGLLPAADADVVARQVTTDPELSARAAALRQARRRLEGLPASQNTNQRVLAHVLSGAGRGSAVRTAPRPQPQPQPQRARNRAVAFVAASVVLVLLAGVMALASAPPPVQELAVAQSSTASAEPARAASTREPAARRQRPSAPRIVPPARTAQQAQPAAPPVRVTIPKMQVDKRLVGLSVLADGTLAAPEEFGSPGWYREGVVPGDAGPAVIVGHVDSMDGPAVFFKLETLQPGDRAHVKRADGTTVTFVVDRVERVPKDSFPTQRVYGPTPNPELRLITCGGAFDNTTLSYDDNVIAFAHLEPPRSRGSGGRGKSDKRQDGARSPAGGGRTTTRDGAGMPSYDHLGRLREPDDSGRREPDKNDRARRRSDSAAGA